jgi:uncharacterized membrane protein YbhN (UPF0104 family)
MHLIALSRHSSSVAALWCWVLWEWQCSGCCLHIERFMPGRIMRHYRKVEGRLFGSLPRPALPVGISVLIWICDGFRVLVEALALRQYISFQEAIMVALLSSLVSIVPITPAGLGFAEGIMIFAPTATACFHASPLNPWPDDAHVSSATGRWYPRSDSN